MSASMPRLKELVLEIHRRSLWQVLAVYVGASWIVLQVVDTLTDSYGLPEWFPALALALLLIGLPIVLATAIVQEGVPSLGRGDPTLIPETSEGRREIAAPEAPTTGGKLHRLFTWRNAITGGVLVFAAWGVISAGWLLTGFSGLLVRAEAADFFEPSDPVLVAEFENETDQEAIGLAVREAIVTDLDGSEYVNVVDRSDLEDVLQRMRLADTVRIDQGVAVEVARREGYPAVVAGVVAPLGAGYQISARILEPGTGDVAVRLRETAADGSEVVGAVERLSRLVRRHLGESLTSLSHSPPLPEVTTGSLKALELFARGRAHFHRNEIPAAVRLFERAVALDSAFASAHRALAVSHGNMGNFAAAYASSERAYRYAERLPRTERLLAAANYHAWSDRLDSVTYYYELVLERDPDDYVAVNNLGNNYEMMGRYEDALPYYRRTTELRPDATVGYVNVASAARTLGRMAEAESAAAEMRTRFPDAPSTAFTQAMNAYYAGDFDRVKDHARRLANDSMSPALRSWGYFHLALEPAVHGRIERALAIADSTARLAAEGDISLMVYAPALLAQQAALAAGAPERALPYLDRVLKAVPAEGPATRYFVLGIVGTGHALANQRAEARRILERMDSLTAEGVRPSGWAHRVRAILALQENRPAEAVEHLDAARDAYWGVQFRLDHLLRADAYVALDRRRDAVAHYDTVTSSARLDVRDAGNEAPLRPVAHERLGSLHLALGDTAEAIRHLSTFTEMWADADPELQPRVDAARRTIARLVAARD